MLSVAPVRSASGAASYFAKDDYYTIEGSSEVSLWEGEGARELGLQGEVSKDEFEATLNGFLPNGEAVAQVENRRAGFDLTFSMPKSASVMAYVAGDRRVLAANMAAVTKTMAWVEKNLAEGRRAVQGEVVPVKTGNLVYALFQHDTSRALDPQAHIHAVIANLTRMPDGKWHALHADKVWSRNTVIGAVYHAFLRREVERLGYTVELKGKHGTFEIAGVPKGVIDEFSRRRHEIRETSGTLGISSPEGRSEVAQRTRDPKLAVEDRDALKQQWVDRAASLGFDGAAILEAAEARSGARPPDGFLEKSYRAIAGAIDKARIRLDAHLRPRDPLVDANLARSVRSPEEARTQLAVASAIRILGEREAAWPEHSLTKTALDLGLKGVTVDLVEGRIADLLNREQLLPGVVAAEARTGRMITTPELLRTEEQILAAVKAGEGRARPVVSPASAPDQLQSAADKPLNAGQLAAASMILSSEDRTVIVQGVAGAGKSTMLQAVASVVEGKGRALLGLAFQNKMVADLSEGAGIPAETIASFVLANEAFIIERDTDRYEAARERVAGMMIIVDETSMVSSDDMLKLHRIVDALDVDKLVLVGDRQQLSSIDAGKAFAMIQAKGATMARMDENIRQTNPRLRAVAALANRGQAGQALRVLGEKVIEAKEPALAAAELWLSLPEAERSQTAVFASGRAARAIINRRIQDGLVTEGAVKGKAATLTVYDRINLTAEELRHASTYEKGQTLEVGRGGAPEVGLREGRYAVEKVHPNGRIELMSGRRRIRFDPQRLSPIDRRDRLLLAKEKTINLREGDRIRWTANDKPRGLLNSATARVLGVDAKGVTVEVPGRHPLTLSLGDSMLSRLDLAYSLNMHMAQGITTPKAITVMSSQERQLSNQRLFNVGVTRVREELTMVVDDRKKLTRQLQHNPGNKTSALEVRGKLDIDEKLALPKGAEKFDPGPIEGLGLPDGLAIAAGSPEKSNGFAENAKPSAVPADGTRATDDLLPPLPERSLGLDL
ncbi:conjugative relaxase [Sphingopyxis indica]|uniref:MobF family relaxase n=1 Tax=Sphingopyxis indica TaxID=436663 RepID=UPI002939297A|nr:MobF family relaxase [Sphingopyxis indica]WOF45550.1 conjugative relaxase [Sphingopyxis indica]